MHFAKYEATGNDFIMVDGRRRDPEFSPAAVRNLCRRHTGVGADGLIVLLPSEVADFRMLIFNADGTEAEMCGNGIRALFLFALDRGAFDGDSMEVETVAGSRSVRRVGAEGGNLFTVSMGEPACRRSDVPMKGDPHQKAVGVQIPVGEESVVKGTCLSMGNPHCVTFVDRISGYPVSTVGRAIETLDLFPEKTNVEFVEIKDEEHLMVRVWERGVGETLACGTGACASLVASRLGGLCAAVAKVTVPGGDLQVEWNDNRGVFLTGPARQVYDGETWIR